MDEKFTIEYTEPDKNGQRDVAAKRHSGHDGGRTGGNFNSSAVPEKGDGKDSKRVPQEFSVSHHSEEKKTASVAKEGRQAASRRDAPPRINLPFTGKRKEVGEAVYDRRVPILITVAIYLLLSILLVTSKMIIEQRSVPTALTVDIQDIERLARELDEAQKLNDMLRGQAGSEPVRNIASNSAAESSDLRNYRHPSARSEEYLEQSREIDEKMAESREIYEQQLLAVEQQAGRQVITNDNSHAGSVKVDGAVSVSYTIINPVREARNLFVPAYRCRGGGVVVVDVTVDRNGVVVEADVARELSEGDRCMTETAVEAAYSSRFNVDGSAPARHEGRITYTFVPQNR